MPRKGSSPPQGPRDTAASNAPPATREHARTTRLVALALIALVIAAAWTLIGGSTREVASFARPDGHYRVVVLRKTRWPAVMPGQSGDAPGVVRLFDAQERLLHEVPVATVQQVDRVDWGDRRVDVKLAADWSLPD